MSRTTLDPGDVLMIAPDRAVVVTEENTLQPNPGFIRQQAIEALRKDGQIGKHLIYKAWDENTQTSYAPPQSYLDEVERRQEAVQASGEAGELLGKIRPAPLDLDAPRQGLM